ncbi:hypothetical protein ACFY4I_15030 [Streptomyces scabiei]|uniref:hypothetical protein n=1 Tax=Streptomyces scabiei TaxID=1930 RepID=UPI00369C3372
MQDWIYILNPNKDTLDGEPSGKETVRRLAHEDPDDPGFSYRVGVTLLPGPTDALYGKPVDRDEVELGQVRSVQRVKPTALKILVARVGP